MSNRKMELVKRAKMLKSNQKNMEKANVETSYVNNEYFLLIPKQ